MISHRHQCIFIHIPKTAGTSIEKKLGAFDSVKRGVQDHRSLNMVAPLCRNRESVIGFDFWRLMVSKLKFHVSNRKKFGLPVNEEIFDAYFKFAFVRNPWGRALSWYLNVIRDPRHRERLNVSESCTFDDFLEVHVGRGMLAPQTTWICYLNGQIGVDFVGRYECLATDFAVVAGKLGLESSDLPHLLKGEGGEYRERYSLYAKDLVANIYRRDIELFDYSF